MFTRVFNIMCYYLARDFSDFQSDSYFWRGIKTIKGNDTADDRCSSQQLTRMMLHCLLYHSKWIRMKTTITYR